LIKEGNLIRETNLVIQHIKILTHLAITNKREYMKRLIVNYKNRDKISISFTYFDKNYINDKGQFKGLNKDEVDNDGVIVISNNM
jgi:hypothetical protein